MVDVCQQIIAAGIVATFDGCLETVRNQVGLDARWVINPGAMASMRFGCAAIARATPRSKTRYSSRSATAGDHARQHCPTTPQVSVMDDQFGTYTHSVTADRRLKRGWS